LALFEVVAYGFGAVEGPVEVDVYYVVPGLRNVSGVELEVVTDWWVLVTSTVPSRIPESAVAPALAMKASILPKSLMTSLTSCSQLSYWSA